MEENTKQIPQSFYTSKYPPFQNNQTALTPNSNQPIVQPIQNTQTNLQQSVPPQSIEEEKPKSGKKVFFILFGIIAFVGTILVVLFILLTPTVKGLSTCMVENNQSMDLASQRGIAEKWNNQQKCTEFKPITEELLACYERVRNKGILPEGLAFILGSLINSSVKNVDKESIIQLHNTNCSQYPETLINK